MQRNPFKQDRSEKNDYQKNAFRRKRGFENSLSTKEKEWGKKKFTPVPSCQPATPWAKFKNEILQKQQEDINAGNNLNMGTEEAHQFLKQREANYRRLLITESRKEPAKWEDFTDDVTETHTKNKHNKKGRGTKKLRENSTTKSNQFNAPIVDSSLLKDFDSKKLKFEQNNKLRKVITKTTHFARGHTLKSVVEDLKRHGLKVSRTQKSARSSD